MDVGGDEMKFIAFFTSVISASYGLAKFLRVGPIKIVPGSSIAHGTFLLAFASIAIARFAFTSFAFASLALQVLLLASSHFASFVL